LLHLVGIISLYSVYSLHLLSRKFEAKPYSNNKCEVKVNWCIVSISVHWSEIITLLMKQIWIAIPSHCTVLWWLRVNSLNSCMSILNTVI